MIATPTTTEVVCPACHGTKQSPVLERYGTWSLFECFSCGLQHFWPARNPGADWYEESDMYQARDLVAVDWLAWYHRAALKHLSVRSGRLIDVGCGNGAFVAAARRHGFDAAGIDFSAKAIAAGRERFGLDTLHCANVDEYTRLHGAERFEVVTAFEVLEHMDDARRFLHDLLRLLAPGGHLVLSVPNRERFPRLLNEGDYPPHHFTRWSREVIARFLASNGLEVRSIVLCPPDVTMKAFLLHHLRFNIVMGMLKRAEGHRGEPERAQVVGRARRLMLLKDRLAAVVAKVVAPLASPFVRGPMLVATARKAKGPSGTTG